MRKSPRQVECCAALGPESQGETAFPLSGFLVCRRHKRKRTYYPKLASLVLQITKLRDPFHAAKMTPATH